MSERHSDGTVQWAALRDQRLANVEEAAADYADKAAQYNAASRKLTARLKDADDLNRERPNTVTDAMLADWVNQGIPDGATAPGGRSLKMSMMAVRRRLGKAGDYRRGFVRKDR